MKKVLSFTEIKPNKPYIVNCHGRVELVCFFGVDKKPKYSQKDIDGRWFNWDFSGPTKKKVYAEDVGESGDTMMKYFDGMSTSGIHFHVTELNFNDFVTDDLTLIDKTHPLYDNKKFKALSGGMMFFISTLNRIFK